MIYKMHPHTQTVSITHDDEPRLNLQGHGLFGGRKGFRQFVGMDGKESASSEPHEWFFDLSNRGLNVALFTEGGWRGAAKLFADNSPDLAEFAGHVRVMAEIEAWRKTK